MMKNQEQMPSRKANQQNKDIHPAVSNLELEDFYEANGDAQIICIVHIKSGTLNLIGCNFSVESVMRDSTLQSKVLCLVQRPGTQSFISHCTFRGGGPEKAATAGIYIHKSNAII